MRDLHRREWGFNRIGSGTVALIVLALFVLMCGTIYYAHKVNDAEADIQRRLAAIRAAGEPMTLAELAAMVPTPPGGDNAALILAKAFEEYRGPSESDANDLSTEWNLIPLDKPLRPEMIQAGQRLLDANKTCLSIVDEALQRKACLFPIPYSQGLAMGLPHLSPMRDMARLLALKTIFAAEAGDGDTAYKSLIQAMRLSERIRPEPIDISQLVRCAMHLITVDGLQQTLNRVDFTSEQFVELQHAFTAAQDPEMMYRVLIGRRCVHFATIADFGPKQITRFPRSRLEARDDALQLFPGRNALDIDTFLRFMDEMVKASKRPFPEQLLLFDDFDRRVPQTNILSPTNVFTMLSGIILPDFGRMDAAFARDCAFLGIARAVIAVCQYQLDNKKLPEVLDRLVPNYLPEIPIDPFDGKPIRYVHDEHGFTVYSIGSNRKDDGGKEASDPKQRWKEGDLTFSVKR